jgi:transcriptional regulator of acetoin/glycerol metabolism
VSPELAQTGEDLPVKDISRHGRPALLLLSQLESCNWNVTAAAQNLGISRMTLYRRMKQHGIQPPR